MSICTNFTVPTVSKKEGEANRDRKQFLSLYLVFPGVTETKKKDCIFLEAILLIAFSEQHVLLALGVPIEVYDAVLNMGLKYSYPQGSLLLGYFVSQLLTCNSRSWNLVAGS